MQLDISENSLNVYKALANPVRLKMIQILSHDKLNVKDLANRVGLSNTITLRHLQILADADIITFEKQGHSKVSRLKVDNISVRFPERIYPSFDVYETDIPVGTTRPIRSSPLADWLVKPPISVRWITPLISWTPNEWKPA